MKKMFEAFRTTVSESGSYEMRFRFNSMADMHAADDEWHAFRKGAETKETFVLRAWDGEPTADQVADELERIANMLREGFTSGEAMVDEDFPGRGWWETGDLADEA